MLSELTIYCKSTRACTFLYNEVFLVPHVCRCGEGAGREEAEMDKLKGSFL